MPPRVAPIIDMRSNRDMRNLPKQNRSMCRFSSLRKETQYLLTPRIVRNGSNDGRVKPPNIVLVITDQQNIDAISAYKKHFADKAYACHNLHTPHLDRMVSDGFSFLQSHSANPVSCPARASLFTGHWSIENGVTYNNIGIDKTIPNLAEWLSKKSEYRCYYAGKWHAGGQWNYPETDGPRKIPGFETIPVSEYGLGAHTDAQVSMAVKSFILNDKQPTPFFVVAGLMNPHDICYWIPALQGKTLTNPAHVDILQDDYPPLPPNLNYDFAEPAQLADTRQRMDGAWWQNYLSDYHRMVEMVDMEIGRILDAVDARGGDTVVIFTSDHGEGHARHARVQKWHPYEESVKVPLIFYCPGYIRAGEDTKTLVSGIDVFPTICQMAGVDPPESVNGKSLLKYITGVGAAPKRDHIIVEFMHTGRVVRNAKYKYVKMYIFSGQPDAPFVRRDNNLPAAFVPGKQSEYKVDPALQLFDMENDPWETVNLACDPAYAQIIKQMEKLLSRWEDSVKPGFHFDRN